MWPPPLLLASVHWLFPEALWLEDPELWVLGYPLLPSASRGSSLKVQAVGKGRLGFIYGCPGFYWGLHKICSLGQEGLWLGPAWGVSDSVCWFVILRKTTSLFCFVLNKGMSGFVGAGEGCILREGPFQPLPGHPQRNQSCRELVQIIWCYRDFQSENRFSICVSISL